MRPGAALLVFALLGADQAAACHKFSIWHFRQPQRCPAVVRVAMRAEVAPPAPKPPSEDELRAAAIEKLRALLEK